MQLFMIALKSLQCFKDKRENYKAVADLQLWTAKSQQPQPRGGKILSSARSSGRGCKTGLASKLLIKIKIKISYLVYWPSAAAVSDGNCR